MTKKRREAVPSKWEALPWRKVDVSGDDDTNDENFLKSKNHYDSETANPNDLFDIVDKKGKHQSDVVDGADDPGIFLGLEVIDGSKYKVEKVSVADGYVTKLIINDVPLVTDESKDGQSKDVISKNKRKEREDHQMQLPKTLSETTDKYDGIDFSTLSRKEKNKIKLNRLKQKRKEKAQERKRQRVESNEGNNNGTLQLNNISSKKQKSVADKTSSDAIIHAVSQQEIDSIRNSWAAATSGLYLHPKLCAALYRMGFHAPTPIQASTLAASILGQRDIVGAAPTGSGKTLGYLLPILHSLLMEEEEMVSNNESIKTWPLTALVLCPTRELAMQVAGEFNKLIIGSQQGAQKSCIKCETIVGGLSEQKQKRVLDIKRPALLVCTPGRLWDLLSSGDHDHLNQLKFLRFLVVDEADRMVSQGSFPQLSKIFEKIQQANPSLSYLEENAVDEEYESEDEDRLLGLPGVKGEAKVVMLDDKILRMIEAQRTGKPLHDDDNSDDGTSEDIAADNVQPIEMDDEEYEAEQERMNAELEASLNVDLQDKDEDEKEEEKVKRQTFIFSATLSLPPSTHYNIESQSKRSKKGLKTVDGAIAEIMEKVGAQGQVKVVDLSTTAGVNKKSKGNSNTSLEDSQGANIQTKLPPGLSLYEIKCTQKHKDSHLYAYLTTTKQGSSGTSLVFCNSIGAVKRVAETLKTLGLPTRTLHAQMEQKSRIASIESLNGKNSRSIVVCTDVAARGLDIPNVASVIHYDVARAVDTFIHRAGRTARGVGESAVGWSVSLVSASEEKNHLSICRSVKGASISHLDAVPLDSRLLSAAQERVNLASKIVACESVESRTNKNNQWFIEASKEVGVDLDEELLDDGLGSGSQRQRQQISEARQARQQLKVLLAKPMRKQNFGKFLSSIGLQDSIATESTIKPHVVRENAPKKHKKRR